jgi:ABC-type transporter MlaC component
MAAMINIIFGFEFYSMKEGQYKISSVMKEGVSKLSEV